MLKIVLKIYVQVRENVREIQGIVFFQMFDGNTVLYHLYSHILFYNKVVKMVSLTSLT